MAAPSAASRPHAPRNQRKSERTQTSTDTNSAEPSEAAAGEGKDPVTKKVVTASDGEEALALLAEESFDLVLSDVRMPRLDGWGFLDALSERNRPPVVIMMSAYGDRDAALNVMKLGAYDYVSKPFTTEDVLLTLRKAEGGCGAATVVTAVEELSAKEVPHPRGDKPRLPTKKMRPERVRT